MATAGAWETLLGRRRKCGPGRPPEGMKPGLGSSRSRVCSSAQQPWDGKAGQLLVSHSLRLHPEHVCSAPGAILSDPTSPEDKIIWGFKTSVQLPKELISGSEKAVFQSWRHQKCHAGHAKQKHLASWAPLWAWCMFPPSQVLRACHLEPWA